jgi:hypothetical protein
MLNPYAVALAAEETAEHASNVPNPWLVGGIVLGILLVLLVALLMFGAGREHS